MDKTLKGINASTSGMKKSEKAHAHSGLLSYFGHSYAPGQLLCLWPLGWQAFCSQVRKWATWASRWMASLAMHLPGQPSNSVRRTHGHKTPVFWPVFVFYVFWNVLFEGLTGVYSWTFESFRVCLRITSRLLVVCSPMYKEDSLNPELKASKRPLRRWSDSEEG